MQFKQGDKAVCALDGLEVEVQFGPVEASSGKEAYLVKFPSGDSSLVWTKDLEPAPRFKVGQKVTFSYSAKGESFELISGPYPAFDNTTFWVIKDEHDEHSTAGEVYMKPFHV